MFDFVHLPTYLQNVTAVTLLLKGTTFGWPPFFVFDFVYLRPYGVPMAQTPEKKVKARVVEILKAHGAYYFFPATFGMGRSGVPDIVCCVDGKFLAIECKAGAGKTTALQNRELELIKKAGGVQMVVNEKNISEVAVLLSKIRNYRGTLAPK